MTDLEHLKGAALLRTVPRPEPVSNWANQITALLESNRPNTMPQDRILTHASFVATLKAVHKQQGHVLSDLCLD